jgi:hypothetical protein
MVCCTAGRDCGEHGTQQILLWVKDILILHLFHPQYAILRSLIMYSNSALAVVEEALLCGDFLHIFGAAYLASLVGGWTGGNITGVIMTLFFIGVRIYFIQLMYRYEVDGAMQTWFS